MPVTWAPRIPRNQSFCRDTDSSFSGLRSTVRCEGAETREGQGKHYLCQHLGREDSGEDTPGTYISSLPQRPGSFLDKYYGLDKHRGNTQRQLSLSQGPGQPWTPQRPPLHCYTTATDSQHKTPRDKVNVWERRVSKQGCTGWSCSEASQGEQVPALSSSPFSSTTLY